MKIIGHYDEVDKWFIEEIVTEMNTAHSIERDDALKLIEESNLPRLLSEMPEHVHHESVASWAKHLLKRS